jgi:Cation transport protein
MFIIAIVEGPRLQNTNEYAFTLFSVLFEIVSAYGTVGLSLGYPTINASFSAEFKTISKLVIIAMQIRGRHRGLPYELDRAVLLPSESLHAKEVREGERLMQRRRSSVGTTMSAVDGTMDSNSRFRPETGMTSGFEHPSQVMNNNLEGRMAAAHTKHARQGLGTAMFKLATAPDTIKEELNGERQGAVAE